MNTKALFYGLGGSAVFAGLYVFASHREYFWVAFPLFVLSFAVLALAGDRIKQLTD
ncbi:MAG: hypothetical protein K9K66_16670 [Desulfarculaceae bacterium]|nr:hypothetical protein [Desulfarculaceae bacterium]MCF8074116.1 hypothetical protein [Desulfarculaceae bacterium]MCF8103292.1 hypothetical protein [Desulfarculaceae bacterium]MCF8116850.1 hypothetical protein [Desulfarculaceae bacterium]